MNKRKKIEEKLEKIGITSEVELNAAIKELKPINLSLMMCCKEEKSVLKAG